MNKLRKKYTKNYFPFIPFCLPCFFSYFLLAYLLVLFFIYYADYAGNERIHIDDKFNVQKSYEGKFCLCFSFFVDHVFLTIYF